MRGSEQVALEVVVRGRVQGVFFRASCEREARQRHVTGWVTNEPGGSVRAWFEGAPDDVDAMRAWCGHGPAGAAVQQVEAEARPPAGHRGFDVR
jgi:acylphosphatase